MSLLFMILYMTVSLIVIALCGVFMIFFITQFIAIFTTDAPYVPLPKSAENAIAKNLNLKDDSVLYDLGCGDGRVLTQVVESHPNIRAVGVEISFFPYILAKFRTRKFKNIIIRRENIFTTNISDATHIFMYLYPEVINKLISKIRTECKPGTVVMSCDFELINEKPTSVIPLDENAPRGKKIIVYTI